MSLAGAMNSAVTALKSQSTALAIISDNLSNSTTTAYKANTTSFKTLVTQSYSSTAYYSGGVSASVRQNLSAQGTITTTTNSTDLAIDGDGWFVVTYGTDSQDTFYTRDGEFEIDSDGYMHLGDYYLQGWETDSDGNVLTGTTSSTLTDVNVNRFTSTAEATTLETMQANLPADAEVGDTVTTTLEVFDSLGTSHTVTVSFEKTADNEWSVSFSDPVYSSDTSTTSGTVSGGPYTLTFEDGALTQIDGTDIDDLDDGYLNFSLTDLSDGASDVSSVTLDLGQESDGTGSLTQYSTNDDDPDISVTSISGDGVEYGALSDVEVDESGVVWATYDNGQSIAIYQLAVADFSNTNGLENMGNGVYQETSASGDATLHVAGEDGVGTITASALESSTVDSADEFTRMIVAQQAYSSASKVISTVKDMFDDLMSAMR